MINPYSGWDDRAIGPVSEDHYLQSVYRWLDDNCVVVIAGYKNIQDHTPHDQVPSPVTHNIEMSALPIQDPSVSFAYVVGDGWKMGIRLIVIGTEVYRWWWTVNGPLGLITYQVSRIPVLDQFVAEAIRTSKNVIVWDGVNN